MFQLGVAPARHSKVNFIMSFQISDVTKEPPPDGPPFLRKAVRMIASLCGFLDRKVDGESGTTTLCRELQRQEDIATAYALAESLHRRRDGP